MELLVQPDLVRRFQDDLAALVGVSETPLAVAVSGGPDSMALLALAAASGPTIAATVNHRLRPEAADEAQMVADWCAGAGIPHATLTPPEDWFPRSVQADARRLRYGLLGRWAIAGGARALLTAHHADDQAETFLMRASRGSGVAGLGGIRPVWTWDEAQWIDGGERGGATLAIARPLLGWRRAELRALAEAERLPFVDDPSNADPHYDRARVRAWLADAPVDVLGLARSAAACDEASAALDEVAADRLADGCFDAAGLPRELRRRLIRQAVAEVRSGRDLEGNFDTATNVEAVLDALERGGQATIAGVLASASGTIWHFRPAPPRRSG